MTGRPIAQAVAPVYIVASEVRSPASTALLATSTEAPGAGPVKPGTAHRTTPLTPVVTTSGSPLADAFVRAWQDDVQALRHEQAQTRAALAAITDRLAHTEQPRWDGMKHLPSDAAGIAALALLVRLGREAMLRRARWASTRSAARS